jgi:hypothetical protein
MPMKKSSTSLSLSRNRKHNLIANLKFSSEHSEAMHYLDKDEIEVPEYLTQRVMDFVAAYSVVQPVKNNIPAIEIIHN